MKVTLFNIGKTDKLFIKEAISEYHKRIGFFVDFSIVDIPDVKQSKNMNPQQIKQKEGEALMKFILKADICILLDEKGVEYTSRGFSEWFTKILNQGSKHIAFVTGGAFGFSEEIYKLAHYKMSLSKMTFTHQLVRLVFVEQLYRSFTIIKGIPYHND